MSLAHVRVRSFRNLAAVEIAPGPNVCVLYGENAQGKTNLIEAVYLLSNLQSFRTRRLRDLISFGSIESRVTGEVVSKESSSRLELTLEIGRKAATVDGNTPRSVSSYLGEFHTVIFTPLDLNLSRGNQELRRRFLDRAIFLREPAHLERLQNYNRVLKQRNALLRSGRSSIEVWDESVAALGASIHAARKKTLHTLGPMIASVHEQIAGRPEKMIIACGAPYATGGDLQEGLRRTLSEGRERDRRLGFTGVGPHRDAVRIQLGGKDIERHGSQGQMRTAALSLKLGLLSWGRESLGEAPLFLLDDPASELDRKRLAHLGEFLARWPGQVMTAGTERNAVPVPANAEQRYFRLAEGRVVEA